MFYGHTKICDAIKNCVHHGNKHPCQEVEDLYIFVKKSDYQNNHFYGTLTRGLAVTIFLTIKPSFHIQNL